MRLASYWWLPVICYAICSASVTCWWLMTVAFVSIHESLFMGPRQLVGQYYCILTVAGCCLRTYPQLLEMTCWPGLDCVSSYSVSIGSAAIKVKLECMPLQQIVFICVPTQRGYSFRGWRVRVLTLHLYCYYKHADWRLSVSVRIRHATLTWPNRNARLRGNWLVNVFTVVDDGDALCSKFYCFVWYIKMHGCSVASSI